MCETALGGVGRYQDGLRALGGHDISLHVLLPAEDVRILEDPAGAITFRRGGRGGGALVRLVAAFRLARRTVRPDVYLFNSTFALICLLALRLRGDRAPAIYCAHCWAASNYAPGSAKGRLVQAVEGRLAGLADLVVNVSESDAAHARAHRYRGRHVVVENAVADRAAAADPVAPPFETGNGTVNLLFVGRFDHQKGLDVLLRAFARARARAPHLALHLVGGPVRGGAAPALPEGTWNHGWQPPGRVDAFYAAADALVVPSRWEGLPLTVPEGLRSGTPVLVSDRSDMGALVEPGLTGAVFPLDEEALATLLAGLDRAALRAMRPAARAAFERRFALERLVRELAGHVHALAANRL